MCACVTCVYVYIKCVRVCELYIRLCAGVCTCVRMCVCVTGVRVPGTIVSVACVRVCVDYVRVCGLVGKMTVNRGQVVKVVH